MNQEAVKDKPLILIAPLDWGLGHATRCIPVIKQLIDLNCSVVLAGEGKIKELLQAEFPHLPFIPLQGYSVRYGKRGSALMITLLAQLPKLARTVRQERHWLRNVVEQYKIDAVISDNRFGLSSSRAYSVFITHQLFIKTPFRLTDRFAQWLNYRYINRFGECWVPDFRKENTMAGSLSHPRSHPKIPLRYIGALTRFHYQPATANGQLLIILSGPEPQRTLLEELLLRELNTYTKPVVLVRGLPGNNTTIKTSTPITVINHLPAGSMEKEIGKAEYVIGRCGYSTVMDLLVMRKKSILIPTPGQTEQEYLATHLMRQRLALCIPQALFTLQAALSRAACFEYKLFSSYQGDESLKIVLQSLVSRLTSSR